MSNKKYEHWCDKQYQPPKEDNKFIIGDMAHDIYKTLEKYILYDISKDMLITFDDNVQGQISKNYIVKKVYRILDNAEDIELLVAEANSIYALYGSDYARRRELWLEARGKCFRLVKQLDHLGDKQTGEKFMHKSLNIGNQASQLFSIFYPTRIDNYCKIVKGIKRYGRYMDDIEIIHKEKSYLWQTLDEIRPICDELGLFINEKKTQIHRADCEFKYLNRIYKVTESGHIIERLAPNTIYREAYKIRKYAELGKPIDEQFNSWIGSFKHHMTQWEIDKIYRIKEMA